MWPFSSEKRASAERTVSREEFDDVIHRLKIVEREHDDLHAAYRRLRASRAQEASVEPRKGNHGDPDEPRPRSAMSKDELRRLLLTPRVDKRVDSD